MIEKLTIYQYFVKYVDPDNLLAIQQVAEKTALKKTLEIEFDSIGIVFQPDNKALVCDLYSDAMVTVETADLLRNLEIQIR